MKKYQLPKKVRSAKEGIQEVAASPTFSYREQFARQAEELKEKIIIGPTPKRIEHPKNKTSLKPDGTLKGEVETLEPMKEKDAYAAVDVTKKAQALEAVKKPVFKRKSKDDTTVQAEPIEPVKDERESEDKQPTEAVACEGRARLPLNRMEQDLVSRGPTAIRSAMASKQISRFRGNALLRELPADATEGVDIPKATDKGKPFAGTANSDIILEQSDEDKAFAYEGILDTEIGDEYNVKMKYSSKSPCRGSVEGLTLSFAKTIKAAIEDIGGLTTEIQPARAGGYAVIFSQQEEEVPTTKWYALMTAKQNKDSILQVTINASAAATENDIRTYLEKTYGKENVLQVSKEKLQ